jgi:hypothetical protein
MSTARPFLFMTVLALAGCNAVPTSAQEQTAALTADAAVLPGSKAALLLNQCSRASPPEGDATWQPTGADIAALESALPAALRSEPRASGQDWSRVPQDWRRQYVGIVRGGRRFVYGNFYPREADNYAQDPDRWRHEPVVVCDGGPAFFGAEWDVEAGRLTHLAFNGVA